MSASRVCDWCEKPAPEGDALMSMWWCDYECCSMDCAMLAQGEPVQRTTVTPPGATP